MLLITTAKSDIVISESAFVIRRARGLMIEIGASNKRKFELTATDKVHAIVRHAALIGEHRRSSVCDQEL